MTASSDDLRFGAWEIRASSRELIVEGAVQEVEPKVFDLLLLLIEQRHRVVQREELLDLVWRGVVVSENVIARTVMKARKAISDRTDDGQMIRTVHRVGYRFAGQPQATVVLTDTLPPPAVAPSLLRVGLLPLENLTGDPGLAWIERGLTSLVAQALEADDRLSVATPGAIDKVLESAAANSLLEPRARSVERLLGLHCLVQGTVHRAADAYRLEYRGHGSRGQPVHGRLEGVELTGLAQALAQRIDAQLFPREAAAVSLQSSDAFANQAFARALVAESEERWQSASKLLQVVLDIEPKSNVAALRYLTMLARLDDPAALELGQQLLKKATEAEDTKLLAGTHQALGQAHLNLHGPRAEAEHHMDEALRIASQHGLADWAQRIRTTRAFHEQTRRNYPRARELYDQAIQIARASGNRIELAKIINNRAVIDAITGNLLSAREGVASALRISEDLKLDSSIGVAGSNVAAFDAELGFLNKATELCDALVPRVGSIQAGRTAANVAITLCGIYAERWDVARIDRVLHLLEARTDAAQPGLYSLLAMAKGLRSASRRCGRGEPLDGRGYSGHR